MRNDEYWDDVPLIDEFVYQILPDPEVEVQALKIGEIDILDAIPPAQVQDVEETEGLRVERYDSLGMDGIWFNLDPEKMPVFQDREVRQALLYALDREAINDSIFFGLGEVASGTQPVLSLGYAPDQLQTTYTYDPDLARQLLTQAGWTDSNGSGTVAKDGTELRFRMLVTEGGGATVEQLLSYFQEAWRAIGASLEFETVGDQEWFDRMTISHEFEMTYWGFNFAVEGSQGILFRCDAYEDGFNFMKYCNPEYDRIDDEQLREFDQERRRRLLIELNNITNEDLPIATIRFPKDKTGFATRLHNFFPNGYGGSIWSLPYVWVEQ